MSEILNISTKQVLINFQDPTTLRVVQTEGFPQLDRQQFESWLKDYDETSEQEYRKGHTCKDFTYELMNNFYRDYGYYGIYPVKVKPWGRISRHFAIVVLIEPDPYSASSWLLVEPITDETWLLPEAPGFWGYPMCVALWHPRVRLPSAFRRLSGIRMYLHKKGDTPAFVTKRAR